MSAALALAGCASRSEHAERPPDTAASQAVVFRALGLVGTPYRHGGNTPEAGFDCSGLVGYVYADGAGVALPRTVDALSEYGAEEDEPGRIASGDLVVFSDDAHGGDASHVGIYVGGGRFVHAPKSGGTVRLDSLEQTYWRERFVSARRVL
jgi:cell wall-associated NlpC family hydrolase